MNDLPDACRRAARLTLACVLAWALAACGPGGGGTGTGPIGSLFFATGSVSVPSGVAGASSAVQLKLQDTSVEFATECGRFVFTGDWAANAGATVVLPGRWDTASRSSAATLRLQFSASPADSRQVTATLLDAGGNAIAGPVLLERQQALDPIAAGSGCAQ